MELEKETRGGSLLFAVNGERFELSSVDPSTTLLEFLRYQTHIKSVKLGCGEVASCLTLLCSVNGCSITTSEGFGNSKNGFHPIHQRFSGFHASQCGFCTPGLCVSLFSAIVNAEKTNRPDPPPGFSKLTVSEAEKAVVGHLCRCTGYRAVADACKSFAADVDIEDLGLNSFWNKGDSREVKINKLTAYNHNDKVVTFPEFLMREMKSAMTLDSKRYHWYSPVSVDELQSLLKTVEANYGTRMKLVVGDTGKGYYKEIEFHDIYIDLRHIPELSVIQRHQNEIEIGAAVSISKAIEALKEENNAALHSQGETVFKKVATHMQKIASIFIRNTASVGGNLVLAQRKRFPSDLATVLLAVDSWVNIKTGTRRETLTLEEFLGGPPLDLESVLLSVIVSNRELMSNSSSEMNKKLLFETYRAAPKPLGNALAYLNAAFLAEVSSSKSSVGIMLNNCQLAFGAYGTRHAIRARKVEEYLTGKTLSASVLYEASQLVHATVAPEYGTSSAAYRSSLAIGFLFDFLGPLTDTANISSCLLDGCDTTSIFLDSKVMRGKGQVDRVELQTLLSSSKQVLEISEEYRPVGEPITKSGAAIQASGEAVYVDDIPAPINCLYGTFIYSTKPLARVKGIEFETKSTPDGVIGLISFKDIPEGGENIGSQSIFGKEALFADELTQCAGQPVAFVVANTQKHADMAAKLAVVHYDTEDLEPPILSVEDAVKMSSFFEVLPFIYPKQVGDLSKGMAEADYKINSARMSIGSQYYFYMENQTALAIPDEENCMVVYSSSQCPESAGSTIARCLGIPEHNVRVITRRAGGGFGGKAMRAMPVSTACAVAAHKLQRPVRTYLNRKTDMIMAGGRHPMEITYSVGFKSDGKVTALQLEILVNAGISADISPMMPRNIMCTLKKYNWGALSFDIKVCKTNHYSKSAMRAPGEVQGSFIAEAVIEHVASTLSVDVDSVRKMNLHTYESLNLFYGNSSGELKEYTLSSIWDRLATSSSFKQRTESVKEFNRQNIWQKRGISRVPIVHEVMLRSTPGKVSILRDGSVVVEVGGVEIGQGLWTKVKQMTAYALGLIKCDGSGDLLEKVRVIQSDTLSLIQGGFTAGSTTSEASCEAVSLCCKVLVERLTPLKESLQEQMGSIKWETLIVQATLQSVNLSASSYFVPELTSKAYLNYGAAVTEVEVNILTGETTILRSDIVYDCGKSLNPAVDLGQIEGAFVQGVGFFMLEEYLTNEDGLVVVEGPFTYEIPTIDTIPRQFNVELLNSGHHEKRVLSSKASGEPPLLLASSVHCATRAAIRDARLQLLLWRGIEGSEDSDFQLPIPATMPVVKELCGLDMVESYLQWKMRRQ
ncbi:indole-3-acetaldehyde oxidase-like isoform X2 [Tripterygium wilfordii]|uniref:indole-3-acetaldehyde oxidase-like isoform X2 n=1 Tax=Tripterygium wilfordii TaxID=458696 RepID=UPI0018F82938|nr:indole-3-acetaldehyde oxidase-like isoform X2 [Tripterygium wilfordii]